MSQRIVAGIEAGGTKMICAVAHADGAILAQSRIATGAPDATFAAIGEFFADQVREHGPIGAGGIASFGPIDLDPGSRSYGALTTTPKAGWSSVNMLERVRNILGAPTSIDTDVNCAAIAEARFGAGRGLSRLCYMTVGTGIGVGLVDEGRTAFGAAHAEVGHIRIPHAPGDEFAGVCPSHGDCAEGLACGPAMKARWRTDAETLPVDHAGWEFEAYYIAALCVNLTYTLRPQRIIIGGGVMEHAALYAAVRVRFRALMAGYAVDPYSADVQSFISAPELRDPSPGLVGAIEAARGALLGAGERHHG